MRDIFAQLQSGLRTATALTLLVGEGGKVGGHTGTFVDPSRPRSSQNTSGQSGAHDLLREGMKRMSKMDYDKVEFESYHMLLGSMAHGLQALGDADLMKSGATPNLLRAKTITELAGVVHDLREEVKRRVESYRLSFDEKAREQMRPPSPARLPMSDPNGAGQYLIGPSSRPSDMPELPATFTIANRSAYISQPFRIFMK
jgi:hypothetical protein